MTITPKEKKVNLENMDASAKIFIIERYLEKLFDDGVLARQDYAEVEKQLKEASLERMGVWMPEVTKTYYILHRVFGVSAKDIFDVKSTSQFYNYALTRINERDGFVDEMEMTAKTVVVMNDKIQTIQ
jgi:hypothetical protein